MKKGLLLSAQIIFFALFNFFLFATILKFTGKSSPLTRFDYKDAVYNHTEAYDPSLSRVNSLQKLEQYCDSIYAEKTFTDTQGDFERTYVEIVSEAVRNRFFHGYSYYGFDNNFVAWMVSKATVQGYAATVMPDDILKYPFAACSQQSIVMMEVLKDKGLSTRKISFQGKTFGGHFAFEVFYDNAWHFHDPNMEPDKSVLNKYGRPGIAFLAANPEILYQAYNRLSKEKIMDIFPTYSYGPVDKYPAPRAAIFHKITNFLSYSGWAFFFIAFLMVRRRYLRIKNGIQIKDASIPSIQPDTTPIYYPDYAAQGA